MSIIIKGMDMPQEPFTGVSVLIASNGCVYRNGQYLSNVEAIELPPHGKLIDAGAFASEMKKRQEEAGKRLREAKDRETAVRADAVLSFLCEVKLTLDAAPTIIETE